MPASTTEEWRPVAGYEGLYEVSDAGHVRSLLRPTRAGLRGGRVLRPHRKPTGHLEVELSRDGISSTFYVHRLVAVAFIANPESHPVVMHEDDNPANNATTNLKWGTYAQNTADAYARGRFPRSQAQHGSRSMYQSGCHCPGCVAANTAYDRDRRASNPRFVEQQRAAKRRYYARQKSKQGASDD